MISESIGFILSVIGALPKIGDIGIICSRRKLLTSVCGFSSKSSDYFDIVVTQSDCIKSDVGKASVLRSTTAEGEVRALGVVLSRISSSLPRSRSRVHISNRVSQKLSPNLIILGGPAKNMESEQYIKQFMSDEKIRLEFNALNSLISYNSSVIISDYDYRCEHSVPRQDIGMVIIDRGSYYASRGRKILCMGFTTYGTYGAANFFFDDVLKSSKFKYYRRAMKRGSPMILVVECYFDDGVMKGSELKFAALREKGDENFVVREWNFD